MPSKPLQLDQIGRSFTSNSELREYKQTHPEAIFLNKGDREWDEHYTDVRNRAEKTVKRMGFRDVEDYRSKGQSNIKKQSEADA
jgi:hypothetical protein